MTLRFTFCVRIAAVQFLSAKPLILSILGTTKELSDHASNSFYTKYFHVMLFVFLHLCYFYRFFFSKKLSALGLLGKKG